MSDHVSTTAASVASATSAPAATTTTETPATAAPAAGPAPTTFAEKEKARASILANHAKTKLAEKAADTEPASDADGNDGAPELQVKPDGSKAVPKTEPKKDRPVAEIARLSKELRETKAKLAAFDGKTPGETKAEFIAKVKADPSLLFTEVDDPELLTKLANARYRELSPEEKLKAEFEAKTSAIEKKLADAENDKKEAGAKAVENQVYTGTSQVLNDGFKGTDEDGAEIVIDNSKWPLCRRVTKAGEADAPREAMSIITALTKDLGRVPNHRETATFLEIAFDQLEQKFSKKAEAYRLDAPATKEPPKTNTNRPKDQRPKTISGRMASGGRPPVPAPEKKPAEKKAEILERYRVQRLKERAAAAA